MEGKIFAAIPKVMHAIGSIGKDRKNAVQGYSFRGIDDLYNAASEALIAHEVFTVPVVLDMKREERQTKSGGGLIYTILTIKYTFYASDGSHFEAVTIGEAMDSGDKSCNKAMSAAQKYAFLQVFAIPTEEPKDTENSTHEVAPKKQNKTENKPASGTISEPQRKRLFALAGEYKWTDTGVKEMLLEEFKFTSSKEITTDKYEAICKRLAEKDGE